MTLGGKARQFIAASSANLATMMYGISVGWVSPSIPLLMSDDTPLPSGPLSRREASLTSALLYMAGMVGSLSFGWLADRIGRKWALFLGTCPHIIAHLLIIFAQDVNFLYVSRVFSGLGCGALFVVLPIYVSEISEDKVRGTLGAIFCNMVSVGIVIGRCLGSYLDFYVVPYVVLGLLAVFVLTFPFFPETPQYLLLKRRESKAEKSLKRFRGAKRDANGKMPEKFETEFEALKNSPTLSNQSSSVGWDDFKPATTRKAILISLVLISGRSICGVLPLDNYTASVLRESGSTWDANLGAIIVGLFELIGSNLAIVFVERWGRRKILIVSSLGSALCLSVMGILFLLRSIGLDMSSFGWLSVAAFSGQMTLAAIGIVAIPFSVSAEVLPPKLRGVVCTSFLMFYWILTFFIVNFFLLFAEVCGMYTPMWCFAGWCIFELIFVYFYLPETKGKNFEEIVLALQGKQL
ncbi:facilitated trehalose transporter Tret1-like [Phlebotomus argentipes]|uniref:facilitated trehalose transporter Tret1-like n=1 Tax=Phlebotomus argentipes TaxID=94469 RepID=UPI0028934DA6|nr:facilitated trehalose transporter Tret1-like [Phlebotomus argentipes]